MIPKVPKHMPPPAPTPGNTQDRVNARVYHAAGIERQYRSNALIPVEVNALLKYQPAFAGRDVLDIGIGTGRTSAYLAPLARHYEGIDYSPVMVSTARARLPGLSLREADMRNLTAFDNGSFDFVFAANNVLDAVSHEDRQRALHEWYRLLRPRGLLMFSSHNRRYQHATQGPRLTFSRNPATQAALLMQLARGVINYRRVGGLRREETHYALLNDPGHDFAILHYYIDRDNQTAQLRDAGFEMVDVFDHHGISLTPGDFAVDSPWLMYVARPTAGSPEAPVTTS